MPVQNCLAQSLREPYEDCVIATVQKPACETPLLRILPLRTQSGARPQARPDFASQTSDAQFGVEQRSLVGEVHSNRGRTVTQLELMADRLDRFANPPPRRHRPPRFPRRSGHLPAHAKPRRLVASQINVPELSPV